jgi:hypothetical protein
LAKAIDESDNLQTNWSTRTDDDRFADETNAWINKVGHLIEAAYGQGEAKSWNNDAGEVNYTDGKKHTDLHNAIIHRAARLKALLSRVDTLPIREGFEPKNYK